MTRSETLTAVLRNMILKCFARLLRIPPGQISSGFQDFIFMFGHCARQLRQVRNRGRRRGLQAIVIVQQSRFLFARHA
jgi:hypothetical protein